MRKLYTILLAFLVSVTLFAQVPQKMNYQAVIRNSSNQLVTSHAVGISVSILQGSSTGTPVYVETQAPMTNANGLVTIEIGGGTPVTGTFEGIDWTTGTYFIKTETDPAGGTSYAITATSQLLSVPYALYAKTAGGHYVGELYGGGIVVAVWKISGVEKGLIASLVDVSAGAIWSSITGTLLGITAQSLHNGQANTTAIVSQGDVSGAAYICSNYSSGGFSDWYLPSAWELYQCYDAALIVNEVLGNANGFQGNNYWSSTEADDYRALLLGFSSGPDGRDKSYSFRVRAVRRF